MKKFEDPTNEYQSALEKQFQQKIKDRQKKNSLEQRIEKITGKTRQKLRLQQIDKGQRYLLLRYNIIRFNKMIEQMKGLETFIDVKDQIQKLNALNNKELIRQLEHYHAIKKYRLTEKEGILQNLQNDKLYKELDQLQNEKQEYQDDGVKLEFLSKVFQLEQNTKNKINIHKYIKDRNLIIKSEDKIKSIYHQTWKDEIACEEIDTYLRENRLKKLAYNNEQQDIFNQKEMMQSIKKIEENLKIRELKELEMKELMEKNTQKLIQLAKEYGIKIDSENFFMNNSVYHQFKKRTQQLIKQIEEEAKLKYNLLETSPKAKNQYSNCKIQYYLNRLQERMLKQKKILGFQRNSSRNNLSADKSPTIKSPSFRSSGQCLSPRDKMTDFSNQLQQFNKTSSTQNSNSGNFLFKKIPNLMIDVIQEEIPNEEIQICDKKLGKSASQPCIIRIKTDRINKEAKNELQQWPSQNSFEQHPSELNDTNNFSAMTALMRKKRTEYNRQIKLFNNEFEKLQGKAEDVQQELIGDQKEDQKQLNEMENEVGMMIGRYELKQKLRQLGFSQEETDFNQHLQFVRKKKLTQSTLAKQIRSHRVNKYF